MKLKKKVIFVWIIVLFCLIASLFLDNILVNLVSLLRNNTMDSIFIFITYLSSEVIIFAIITALFLWEDNKREWILPLWITIGISTAVSLLLKVIVQRARPFQAGLVSLLPALQEKSYDIWNFSFPSNHSMLAFCVVPILAKQYPKLKKVWIGIAVLIAFSRIYLGLHFFSDVIAGGAIGYLIGMMIVKLEKEHKFGKRIYGNIAEDTKKKKQRRRDR